MEKLVIAEDVHAPDCMTDGADSIIENLSDEQLA